MESVEAKQNTMNQRLYDRNIPTGFLQPYFDFRPAMTKYTHLPLVEPLKPLVEAEPFALKQPTFSPHQTFNPGSRAPWSGYQVNTESILRNQIFALQKGNQAVYVPSSTSDLYEYKMPLQRQQQQPPHPHPYLVDSWQQSKHPHPPTYDHRTSGLFYNNSRTLAKPDAPLSSHMSSSS